MPKDLMFILPYQAGMLAKLTGVLGNAGVIILRRTRPEMPRPFRVPFSPVFPLIGIALCFYLMAQLPLTTWVRFFGWLAAGMLIYVLYGYRHSRLRRGPVVGTAAAATIEPR